MDIIKAKQNSIKELYSPRDFKNQIVRYSKLVNKFTEHFSEFPEYLFSSPGRTEISGNHTDHNHGRVLAAAVDLDTIGAVRKNNTNSINLFSEGYSKAFRVDLKNLSYQKSEDGTTTSLIKGIAKRFLDLGYNIQGFDAFISSNVPVGSGLSSSASIEILIGHIFNKLSNQEKIKAEQIAIIGQWAENNYFNKPCGLMDQLSIAVGGIITIDFQNIQKPEIKKLNHSFSQNKLSLFIVNTGGNHADLTDDYASIPVEMKSVAEYFGSEVCREINMKNLSENIPDMRKKLGDRAILRAIHFLGENNRVLEQLEALKDNNPDQFLKLVNESGNSSFRWLQNCFAPKNPNEQGISLALVLTEYFLKMHKVKGACRVHGGGFAGTIQSFVPLNLGQKYITFMEKYFGKDSVTSLKIRQQGVTCL